MGRCLPVTPPHAQTGGAPPGCLLPYPALSPHGTDIKGLLLPRKCSLSRPRHWCLQVLLFALSPPLRSYTQPWWSTSSRAPHSRPRVVLKGSGCAGFTQDWSPVHWGHPILCALITPGLDPPSQSGLVMPWSPFWLSPVPELVGGGLSPFALFTLLAHSFTQLLRGHGDAYPSLPSLCARVSSYLFTPRPVTLKCGAPPSFLHPVWALQGDDAGRIALCLMGPTGHSPRGTGHAFLHPVHITSPGNTTHWFSPAYSPCSETSVLGLQGSSSWPRSHSPAPFHQWTRGLLCSEPVNFHLGTKGVKILLCGLFTSSQRKRGPPLLLSALLTSLVCPISALTDQRSFAGDQPRLIQGTRRRDGVGEGQDTIVSIRY